MRSHGDDSARVCHYCHKPCAYAAYHMRCKQQAEAEARLRVASRMTPPAFREPAPRFDKGETTEGVVMLSDTELDELQRDFAANGWTWSGKFAAVVAQAKEANKYRRAMRVIAAMGNPRDSKIAGEVLEATKQ